MTNKNYPTNHNNTSFALSVTEIFKSLGDTDKVLKYHQNIVNDYVKSSATHGLLIQHDLGTGKSRIASAIIAESKRPVIFLSAKSLHNNMKKNIQEYEELRDINVKDVAYITLNASNMLTQLAHAHETSIESKFKTASKVNLNDKMLIVDEAHNLFNSITNGSQNAMGLYNAVIRAKNLRLYFYRNTYH